MHGGDDRRNHLLGCLECLNVLCYQDFLVGLYVFSCTGVLDFWDFQKSKPVPYQQFDCQSIDWDTQDFVI